MVSAPSFWRRVAASSALRLGVATGLAAGAGCGASHPAPAEDPNGADDPCFSKPEPSKASEPAVIPSLPTDGAILLPTDEGHRLLPSRPESPSFSVSVPESCAGSGASHVTQLLVCVSAAGSVSRVTIVRPSIRALDAQLAEAIGRWTYRPHAVEGRLTPFCYLLDYVVRF